MPLKYLKKFRYLYFETVYSNPKLVIDGDFINSMDLFNNEYPKSKWLDRVKYLRGSSLIKMGNLKKVKKRSMI